MTRPTARRLRLLLIAVAAFVGISSAAVADDAPLVRFTIRPETPTGQPAAERTIEAKVVVDAEEGGLLLLDRSGRMWPVTPDRLVSREETGETFEPFTQDELAERLREEFGAGVEIHKTKHYVICSEAGREYGRWVGSLFERLMGAFRTHWDVRPLSIGKPEFPLCAIVLRDKQRFAEYALTDAGPTATDALGYYSLLTNRVVTYDLTAGQASARPRSEVELARTLALQTHNVSTVVHEATHQIAFNCGLHVRLADNPFWLVEGMAMYFETPDLKNAAGWRTVGQVNGMRLRDFREYVSTRRPQGALRAMLTADAQFHAADTAIDAYSEAWALTYYLIRTQRQAYLKYLKALAEKPVLERDDPEVRLAEFEKAFGPIGEVERGFMRYAVKLQAR